MTEPLVAAQTVDGVAVLRLNNSAKHNAMSSAMVAALDDRVVECENDPGVHAIVVTGTGRSFSAGADLTDPLFDEARADEHPAILTRGYGLANRLHASDLPLVAAVNGTTIGLGLSLIAHCDLRIAAEHATFLSGYARIGVLPDFGGAVLLPRLLGTARALQLALAEQPLSTSDALSWGLVTEVVSAQDVVARAVRVAARLAAFPAGAVGATRRAMHALPWLDVPTALEEERRRLTGMLAAPGSRAAIQAFLSGAARG